jgi:hypothetical protein
MMSIKEAHSQKKNLSLEGIPQLNNMDLTILYEINTMYYLLSIKTIQC